MRSYKVLTKRSIDRRAYWIAEIVKISGRFGQDASRIEAELCAEIEREGLDALLDHLRLCGSIPERYGHDSSEEKLYSKYTDALLATAFRYLGLASIVLSERADAADVEAVAPDYSLVADAKVFRLSRTAKNQKDFKIEALHGWKRGKPHAMVVCPIYQLPVRSSQIYQQAIARNVCIFSYSHLAVLVRLADLSGTTASVANLLSVLRCAELMNPTKDSIQYWTQLNRTLLSLHGSVAPLWDEERLATVEAVAAAREESLTALAVERESILRMTREEALARLIQDRNVDGRERVIRAVTDTGILSFT